MMSIHEIRALERQIERMCMILPVQRERPENSGEIPVPVQALLGLYTHSLCSTVIHINSGRDGCSENGTVIIMIFMKSLFLFSYVYTHTPTDNLLIKNVEKREKPNFFERNFVVKNGKREDMTPQTQLYLCQAFQKMLEKLLISAFSSPSSWIRVLPRVTIRSSLY